MPNAIDIYQPRYMAEVVRQTPPIPTYFRDTFFNRVITFPTERVDMDLMKGDRKILPYVHPDAGGRAVKMDGFQTKSYAAPLVSGYIVTTAAQMMTRLPGEDLYSGMTPAERAARKLMEEYATLNDACTRREEYMCVEAVKTGLIHVEGPGVKEDIDFDFTNTVSLTGDEQWGGSKAAILNNLEDWVSRVLIEGFANVDTAIMGKTALRKFLDDADVMKKLDNRRVELGIIAPQGKLPGRRQLHRPPEQAQSGHHAVCGRLSGRLDGPGQPHRQAAGGRQHDYPDFLGGEFHHGLRRVQLL